MAELLHTIKSVVNRTGLSAHVLRVWEKRYLAVKPGRTDTNRRRYSDEDVERLALLRDATRGGHSIGAVANLPVEKLRELAHHSPAGSSQAAIAGRGRTAKTLIEDCIAAVNQLDSQALEVALKRGSVELGAQGILQKLIAPLAQAIGEMWRDGTITAAHEHFATAVIRIFLSHTATSFASTEGAPGLVVATPSGQLHELGALLAGTTAANLGWHVIYLGPSLPAAEIAGAATQSRARAVALSLVYPEDDPKLEGELTRLRELLRVEVPILVGGRAAPAYHTALAKTGAFEIKDLAHLCLALDELRKPGST
jgi:DNA-binding transcriptional MerR regulator/methylmalonyl-CoA mutase cobalamin-binding subunit